MRKIAQLLGLTGLLAVVGSDTSSTSTNIVSDMQIPQQELRMQIHRFRDKNGDGMYDLPKETLEVYGTQNLTNRFMLANTIPGEGKLAFYITPEKFAGDVVNVAVVDYSLQPPRVVATEGRVLDLRNMEEINKKIAAGHSPYIEFDLDSPRKERAMAGLTNRVNYGLVAMGSDRTFKEGWNFRIDYSLPRKDIVTAAK